MAHRTTARSAVALVPMLGLCALLQACGGRAQEGGGATEAAAPVPLVEIVQARQGALPVFERLTGTVRASGEVIIYPRASGAIVEVLVQNGEEVKAGQPLVRLQTVGTEAQLAQSRSALAVALAAEREAEARLAELEAQYKRNAQLGEAGLVPVDTVATLRAQLDAARAAAARAGAQVEVARATVAEQADVQRQTVVRAPIAGHVGQREAEVGMRVDEQTALFTIGRLDRLRVEVPVTQDLLTRLKDGQRVEIGVAGSPGEPIVAKVSRISPFLAPGSYSAEVEIDVPDADGRLLPGMFVTTDIFFGESEEATLVPTSALFEHPVTGERGVFEAREPDVATDGQSAAGQPDPTPVMFRRVTVVAEGPQTVGIGGLQPGRWVVVVGQHLLAEQGGEGPPRARTRPIAWDRILDLQRLQRDDLLKEFMERQQRLADRTPGGAGT